MRTAQQLPASAIAAAAVLIASVSASTPQVPSRPADLAFRTHAIDPGASESVAVADINRDGRLDIVSGESWFEAPRWTKHRFRELQFTNQYVDDFSDMILDVDGDGYPDVVSVAWFAKRIAWWQSPAGRANQMWTAADIHSGFNVEFAVQADVDNDGRAQEIVAQQNGTGQAWYEAQRGAFVRHVVSDRTYGHGIGVGDVNGDRRADILTPRGWLEAPADPRAETSWAFHPAWESTNVTAGAAGAKPKLTELGFMYVLDVNGDGRNDVITGAGHDYGVFWFEQRADGTWPRRTIDATWSQAHAVTLADLNGDGRQDIVTGKRYMAHNGNDPGEREPLGVYWYESRSIDGRLEWIRHVVEYGGRVGGGLQIPVVDIDGDGDRDLVCAGKSGLFLLENLTRSRPARPVPR